MMIKVNLEIEESTLGKWVKSDESYSKDEEFDFNLRSLHSIRNVLAVKFQERKGDKLDNAIYEMTNRAINRFWKG